MAPAQGQGQLVAPAQVHDVYDQFFHAVTNGSSSRLWSCAADNARALDKAHPLQGDEAAPCAVTNHSSVRTRNSPKFRQDVQEHARSTLRAKEMHLDVWLPHR